MRSRSARRSGKLPMRCEPSSASIVLLNEPASPMLLDVQDLTVTFAGARSAVTAVDRVSFQIAAGETLGLVGESGSGKSVTAFAILGLLQTPGRVTGGRILFEGRDLLTLSEREMREVRGARIS